MTLRRYLLVLTAPILSVLALGIQANQEPRFEAISIKLSPQWTGGGMPPIQSRQGGPGTPSPTRVNFRHYPLRDLVTQAYGVQSYQISGPAWMLDVKYLQTDTFEVDATLPPGATKDDYAVMLQAALAERFNLKTHREKKQMTGYALVVDAHGHKLRVAPNEPASTDPPVPIAFGATGKDGFAIAPPGHSGLFVIALADRMRVKFMRQTAAQFANWLTAVGVKRPVTDRTGLTEKYDFIIEYRREDTNSTDDGAAPNLFGALQSQLGLKLAAEQAEVEMLVIDRCDRRPSAN